MSEPARNRSASVQLLAISWNLGWPVAAGVVVGHWIDVSLGSSPVATLFFGIGALAVSVWRILELTREATDGRPPDEGDQP